MRYRAVHLHTPPLRWGSWMWYTLCPVWLHYNDQYPAITKNIDQSTKPQTQKYILTKELKFVRFAKPQHLYTYPHTYTPNCLCTWHMEVRKKEREEEEIPQEVLWCTNFVENDKTGCLDEPGEYEIGFGIAEKKACTEWENELGEEGCERWGKDGL